MESVTYTPEDTWAGSTPLTAPEVIAQGEVLPAMAPLGRVTATGLLKSWDPAATDGTEKAIRLTAFAVDATAADLEKEVIYSGMPITEAVSWPGTPTDAQKLGAFDGSQIVLGKLAP